MSKTAFLYHPIFLEHVTGWKHPERRQRLTAVVDRLKECGLWEELIHIEPTAATPTDVAAVHDPAYVEALRCRCEAGELFEPEDTTVGSPGTYAAALMAVGTVQTALDAVMAGTATNGFCAVRPPGHHAERDRAMGFCFFSNVALGARYLQRRHGLKRIAIVDWDIHHGNGTQQAFYDDPSVFFCSIHQHPLYPGSGRACETGSGAGTGFTLNIPVPLGATDLDYQRIFTEQLKPALARFKPEFILVSAGFDAHARDPLGGALLTAAGYATITRLTLEMAAEHCGKRLVSVLEGGYDLEGLAESVEAHVRTLCAS